MDVWPVEYDSRQVKTAPVESAAFSRHLIINRRVYEGQTFRLS